uniref:Uncharacterized protein n=1 Tax=Solanum lycopersicum TaxID=4081 RepID=A0A3Q7FHH8_SOLLC
MPNSSSLLLILSGNLFLQAALALSLTFLLHFIKIPALLLSGLFTYVHPDDVAPNNASSNGVRAAIRRPGTNDSDLKPRKKSKERFEFDENKAQIFRVSFERSASKLSERHLSILLGFLGFIVSLGIVHGAVPKWFFLPASMVLIFLGLSQLGGDLLTNYEGTVGSLSQMIIALKMSNLRIFIKKGVKI